MAARPGAGRDQQPIGAAHLFSAATATGPDSRRYTTRLGLRDARCGHLFIGKNVLVGFWRRMRATDQKIMDSGAGWFLPGGAAYKTGRFAGRRGSRRNAVWLLLTGNWLNWWNYNVGRERAAAETVRGDCKPVIARFADRLPANVVAELDAQVQGTEPEQAVRSLASALVAGRVPITQLEFDEIHAVTTGRLTYGRLAPGLAALVVGNGAPDDR